jgi:hypothetical protein
MTKLVVGRALLRVLQNLVGFIQLFEALLGTLVARVAPWRCDETQISNPVR